ncbi:maleylpyruvate isomerase N-terminal domain-containing protein [Mycobacterium sp. CVI_P3]|uniref:Maleylpyruvate isomerase N-terminal domain-containing protein n=1 Tax=Mycobacterium pinniadriaticum TaxID=2994102 RepID=A0ABT3S787_9MYCO|nr:maleylpyruvate isomerase N-terminal domain-containing protein [Mycobacterium pinniadriaticum]MCX2928772.1 maleylpyruvate isomerase N-terminal domain-containing protein [Mycobacterium pinniadriaticum]MCX2935361.1 maleylpyruvate isomerase N-terminal domain-containing protein [Mycobacterium pinniadriaticum]
MTDHTLEKRTHLYHRAGDHAVAVIAQVPEDGWDSPALGTWTVRTLVGHIGRSFTTVVEYSARPAERVDVADAAEYYLAIAGILADPEQIDARAVQAGLALGDDPLNAVRALRDRAAAALAADDRLIRTIAGGMWLSDYLPTRILELGLHSVDLARAIGMPEALPPEVAGNVLDLAVEVAQRRGDGQALMCALTGRGTLPPGYSIV